MAFTWNQKSIQWYLNASRYGDFHMRLAEKIAPYVQKEDRVCDLGCGLGRLDLQLAAAVSHITCVDVDQTVLDILAQDTKEKPNLSVRCCDVRDIQEKFDVVMMAFFGYPPQLMLECMKLAKHRMIRVVHANSNVSLQPGAHGRKRETIADISAFLDKAGYKYEVIPGAFEFGQPLVSENDARDFIKGKHAALSGQEIERLLMVHLMETGREDFPFYLPQKKDLGIFIIDIPAH